MHSYLQRIIFPAIYFTKFWNRTICLWLERKTKERQKRWGLAETTRNITNRKKKKKEEITKHTRFLSTFKVDVQVDDGGDDDANAGDEEDVDDFVDTDSNWAVAVASASNDDDDIEEDGDGDSESKDNGNDDDDSKWSVFWDKSKMSKQHWT